MFNWTNPADVTSGLGGVRIVYTTTPDAWTSLTPDSMQAVEYAAADMDITAIAANSKIMSALSQTDPATIASPGSLTAHQIYYFRAFTFNDPVQRLYSSPGNDYAALPNQGGGGGPVTLRFELKKSETTKLVICPITIPPGLRDGTGAALMDANGLVKASQLVSLINSQAPTSPAVIVLGKYDPASTTFSVAYDPNGTGTDFTIAPGEGLQVFVNQDFTLRLTGAQ
jgi:hypothetical protein